MCEILFVAKSLKNPKYEVGMPVSCYPDGHIWCRLESKQQFLAEGGNEADWPGDFVIIKIPGLDCDLVKDMCFVQNVDDTGAPYFIEHPEGPAKGPILGDFRVRAWKVAIASLPAQFRQNLIANGEATVTKAQVRNYITRIRDGATHTGLN